LRSGRSAHLGSSPPCPSSSEERYDRRTDTVEEITGRPAESVEVFGEEFVARRKDLFAG
jgi:hypothetical protein